MQRAAGREPVPPGSGPRAAWDRARIVRGLWLFVALTVAGFLVLFARGTLRPGLAALGRLRPSWALLGALQAVLDLALGGLRIWVCVRALGGRARPWTCVLGNTANVFLGGVTPSQSGGGPAQIFLLVRGGLTFS